MMKSFKRKLRDFMENPLYHIVVGGTFIVWLCIMIISYYHAWELYSNIGDFPGRLAHVAVVAFDTVFAISVLVFSLKTIKQIDDTVGDGRVWFGLIFGFLVTAWSNIRASMKNEWILFITGKWVQISAKGWESLVTGLTTPMSLLAIEFALAWMIANREKFTRKISQEGDTKEQVSQEEVAQNDSHTQPVTQSESHNVSHTKIQSQALTQTQAVTQSGSQDGSHSHAVTQVGHQDGSHTQPVAQFESQANEHTTEQSHATNEAHSKAYGNAHTSKSSHCVSEFHNESSHTIAQDHTVTHSHNESHNVDESHKDSSHTVTQSHAKGESHTNSHTEEDSHKNSHTESVSHTEAQARARELAVSLYEQDGKLPSIRKLAEMAGCSEWQARKALQQLRKKQVG